VQPGCQHHSLSQSLLNWFKKDNQSITGTPCLFHASMNPDMRQMFLSICGMHFTTKTEQPKAKTG
jgi:hypothetical protein